MQEQEPDLEALRREVGEVLSGRKQVTPEEARRLIVRFQAAIAGEYEETLRIHQYAVEKFGAESFPEPDGPPDLPAFKPQA